MLGLSRKNIIRKFKENWSRFIVICKFKLFLIPQKIHILTLLQYTMTLRQGPKDPVLSTLVKMPYYKRKNNRVTKKKKKGERKEKKQSVIIVGKKSSNKVYGSQQKIARLDRKCNAKQKQTYSGCMILIKSILTKYHFCS